MKPNLPGDSETLKASLKALSRKYFSLAEDMEDQTLTVDSIKAGIPFRGANLWVLIFAIFVASLGLNVNSTAVIIGAMLISPLMGPIIGMGYSAGVNDLSLYRRSLKNFAIATFVSVLTATLYFFISPISDVQSELLARTTPTIYDVFIALFGGLAGIVAVATKGKGNVLPGVAIATALMPPLCTVGFGLGTGRPMFALGALYLYFINSVFITAATFVGVRVMHFKKHVFVDAVKEKKVKQLMIAVIIITLCPSIYMTYSIVRRSVYTNSANHFVHTEMNWKGTQIISQKADYGKQSLSVVLVGTQVPDSLINKARERLGFYGLSNATLKVIQGSQADSSVLNSMVQNTQNQAALLQDQSARIEKLNQDLGYFKHFETLSATLMPELRTLFPRASTLTITPVVQSYATTQKPDTFTLAVVGIKGNLTAPDRAKMTQWLKIRTASDSLALVIR